MNRSGSHRAVAPNVVPIAVGWAAHRNPGFASLMAGALWYGTTKKVFREDE